MPTIDQLDPAVAASDTDQVLLSQGGIARKVTRAQFLTGLQTQLAVPTGTLLGRSSLSTGNAEAVQIGAGLVLAAGTLKTSRSVMPDAVYAEDFGAVGDGVTDDSAALAAAIASGKPVKFGARTYIVNGQWTIVQAGVVLIGVSGITTLRRASQSGNGAWISVQASGFRAEGIVFDANRAAVAQESWGVFIAATCQNAQFRNCTFSNATGALQGNGLVLQGSSLATAHVVQNCEFSGNAAHGIWVQACSGVEISSCRSHDNGQYGFCVDFNDPTFRLKVSTIQVIGNRAWNNQRGISVGNFNATNTQPPVWGNANPDVGTVLVQNNICHNNGIYGIACAGTNLSIDENLLSNNGSTVTYGGAILANTQNSRVTGNMIAGSAAYGIDCGGSIAVDIAGNYIQGPSIGINAGGGTSIRVSHNYVQACGSWAIVVNNTEADALGQTFGIASTGTTISENCLIVPATASGIWLHDGPQNVLVSHNNFLGDAPIERALRPDTDSYIVDANRYNFSPRATINPSLLAGRQTIVYPDILEDLMLTYVPAGVQSMLSSHQAATMGQISFVRVQAGGSGYSRASVQIGGNGSGATATATISNGTIIGIAVTAPGQGYGAIGAVIPITIVGDGVGAQAAGYAAPPLPEGRRLHIACNVAVTFARGGSIPLQENWTIADLDVAANSDVEWLGTWGTWRASRFTLADYYKTDQSGGALVRSTGSADVTLRPAGGGHIRLSSDAEPVGVLFLTGRGSPQGIATAPPGSDYRDLNGGPNLTVWIKQSGTGSVGWAAIG